MKILSLLFSTRSYGMAADIFLLIARLLCGYAMMKHGQGKITQPLTWMGEESSFPAFIQLLGAVSEYAGGIALMAGVLTRLAAFGIGCTMIVAAWMHAVEFGDPFVSTGGPAYEMAVLFLLLAGNFFFFGPGRLSLDYLLDRFLNKKSDAAHI